MMKRFIPQIDGLEFVCEKITGKKQRMDTFLVESALSTLLQNCILFSHRKKP